MNTRTFQLTESEANALQSAYLHMQDANTKTRFQVVRMYGLGYSVAEILHLCGGSHTSLKEWVLRYRTQGITGLLDHRKGGNRARLKPDQIEALSQQLHTYTPAQLLGRDGCLGQGQFWTVGDLALWVEREHGVQYQSPTSYYYLLVKCGFSNQCPDKHYQSHSEIKIMEFEEQLEKKLSILL